MCDNITNYDQSGTLNENSFKSKSCLDIQSLQYSNNSKNDILYKNIYGEYSWQKTDEIFPYKLTCRKCNIFPSLIINNDNKIDSECNCCLQKNMDAKYFLNNFLVRENSYIGIESNLLLKNHCFCSIHLEKYIYYCVDCYVNLCEKCVSKSSSHYYDLKIFLNNKEINEKISKILKFINDTKDIYDEELGYILKVIKLVLISHKISPNYNVYKSINNIHNFIQKKINNEHNQINNINNIKQNICSEKNIFKLIKVRHPDELKKTNDLIYSINFNINNFNNLNKFTELFNNKELTYLKYLYLSDCHISDVKPLLYLNIPNLVELDLSLNFINDEYIYIFEHKKFHNLKLLNLFGNHFHNAKLFQCFKKYKQLEELMLGQNETNKSLIDIKNIDVKFEITTKEIGLTRGVFSNDSINSISHFIFHNLEILYLSGNNICSLDFVKYLKNVNLKELWLTSNLITDFMPLIQLRTLEKILLNKNPISNMSNLKKFTEELHHLNLIDFRDTKIDINDKYNVFIRKQVEKKIKLKFE